MGASVSSPVFADNGEFFMDTGNIVGVSYQNASKAFSTPVAANSVLFPGFDWTQPFPGASKDGHAVYLTIAHDMPMNETVVQNSSTVLSSLTFGIPNGMMSGGQPLPMNPSWYLCRHIFISTKPEVKTAVDGGKGCSFLSQDCLADLKLGLTKNWGTADDMAMCSQLIHDPIPPSCVGSFGYSRQDVLAADNNTIANSTLGLLQTSKSQQQYSWRIGTGFHDAGDARAYAIAANRTYLVATVWGYSKKADLKTIKVPEVSFACLSSGASYVPPPPPPPPTTTTTTTASTSKPTATATPIPNNAAYYDDFSTGMNQWTVYGGSYSAGTKALVGGDSSGGKALLRSSYSDFIFEADITLPSSSNGDSNAGFLFRTSNPSNGPDAYSGYYAGVGTSGNVGLGRASNNWNSISSVNADIKANQAHHVKVRALGSALDIYVDNMSKPKVSATDGTYSSGMNGVRVYHTGATYDNVQIMPLSFRDDFSVGNMDRWTTYDGSFSGKYGIMIAQSSRGGKALISNTLFRDFVYEADVAMTSDGGNAGLVFRVSSPQVGENIYYGYYVGIGNGFVILGRADNNWNQLSGFNSADIKLGSFHHIMVRAKGASMTVYVDDMNTPKITIQDATYLAGLNGVRVYQTSAIIDNVTVYTL